MLKNKIMDYMDAKIRMSVQWFGSEVSGSNNVYSLAKLLGHVIPLNLRLDQRFRISMCVLNASEEESSLFFCTVLSGDEISFWVSSNVLKDDARM